MFKGITPASASETLMLLALYALVINREHLICNIVSLATCTRTFHPVSSVHAILRPHVSESVGLYKSESITRRRWWERWRQAKNWEAIWGWYLIDLKFQRVQRTVFEQEIDRLLVGRVLDGRRGPGGGNCRTLYSQGMNKNRRTTHEYLDPFMEDVSESSEAFSSSCFLQLHTALHARARAPEDFWETRII